MPNLQSLSLYWHPTVSDETLFLISAFNSAHLERLTLSACQRVSDGAVATVATACRNLRHLDLTRCLKVSHAACAAIGSSCHQLTTLLLYANAAIDDASLIALSQLQVCGSSWVFACVACMHAMCVTVDIQYILINTHTTRTHPQHTQHLRHLDLCGARLVTDRGLSALANIGQALTKVNLTWVPQITDDGVVTMVCGCTRLEWLSLHGNTNITDAVVNALAECCGGTLRALDLGGCVGVTRRSPQELRAAGLSQLECFKLHS